MLGRIIIRVIAMVPGLGLAALGVSGLQSGVEANRGLASVWRLEAEPVSSPESYEATAELLARRGQRDGEISATRGLLFVQEADLARRAGDAEAAKAFYAQAREPLETAVRSIPLEPRAWTALAWVRSALGDEAGAVSALEVAYLSRNLILPFIVVRTRTAMAYWDKIDDGARAMAIEDIRSIWARHEWRRALGELVFEPGADAALQEAFAGNPEAVRWINRARTKLPASTDGRS